MATKSPIHWTFCFAYNCYVHRNTHTHTHKPLLCLTYTTFSSSISYVADTLILFFVHNTNTRHSQVMAMAPSHDIWQRVRPSHHGGAQRSYSQPPTPRYGRSSPPYCEYCTIAKSSVSVGSLASKQGDSELPKLVTPSPSTGLLHVPPVFGMDLLDDIDCAQSKGKYYIIAVLCRLAAWGRQLLTHNKMFKLPNTKLRS